MDEGAIRILLVDDHELIRSGLGSVQPGGGPTSWGGHPGGELRQEGLDGVGAHGSPSG